MARSVKQFFIHLLPSGFASRWGIESSDDTLISSLDDLPEKAKRYSKIFRPKKERRSDQSVFSKVYENLAVSSVVSRCDLRHAIDLGQLVQLLNQETEEQAHISHHPHRFYRAAIAQLRDYRWVDVHTNHLHACWGHVPDADRVQHGRQHQDHVGTLDQSGVLGLSFNQIHLRIG